MSNAQYMAIRVLGVPFVVRFSSTIDEADVARIAASWSRCIVVDGPPAEIVIDAGVPLDAAAPTDPESDRPRVSAGSIEQLEETLTSTLTVRAIGERRSDLLMLHACGLAAPDGRVVALVAASGTGKTTSARTLGRLYGYVSDETVGIRADGSVVPYAKPLSVKRAEGGPKRQIAPDAAGLLTLDDTPLRLASIVLLDRRDDIDRSTLEFVDPLDALCELVPQTSYLTARKRPLVELLEAFQSRGGARRLVYSEAETLPPLIEEVLASADTPAPAPTPAALDLDVAEDDARPDVAAVRRSRVHDAVGDPTGDIVLFIDSTVVRLAGIGPIVWRSTARWVPIDDVVAAVIAVVGRPPEGMDATELVRATLNELADAGVVELSEPVGAVAAAASA
ncbi:hypothetical protein HQQ80_04615 [Microbacteriaceae bacterium VKM Ac-2855]|nr:hypothetical protein [Microbacteriaceae bacterium VKM Ac-2855]